MTKIVVERAVLLQQDNDVINDADVGSSLAKTHGSCLIPIQRDRAGRTISTAGSAPTALRRSAARGGRERHLRALVEACLASRGAVNPFRLAGHAARS